MSDSAYHFDLMRIFFGDKPPLFLLEITLRTGVILVYTLFLLRMMGKRGMGSLTPFEFAIIVALGSAVGDPMFYGDVPLVHSMLVITLIVGMQRGITWLTERNDIAERILSSSPQNLVAKGVIDVESLHREQLSHDELYEGLRLAGVRHLGEVDAAYLEPSGKLSVLRLKETRPGLSVEPAVTSVDRHNAADEAASSCCAQCGFIKVRPSQPCPNCGNTESAKPVLP
ncbi:MAG: DUF421 domain-containing protein [Rhodothermales bacterium]